VDVLIAEEHQRRVEERERKWKKIIRKWENEIEEWRIESASNGKIISQQDEAALLVEKEEMVSDFDKNERIFIKVQ